MDVMQQKKPVAQLPHQGVEIHPHTASTGLHNRSLETAENPFLISLGL